MVLVPTGAESGYRMLLECESIVEIAILGDREDVDS
jgi:hypothetical protein